MYFPNHHRTINQHDPITSDEMCIKLQSFNWQKDLIFTAGVKYKFCLFVSLSRKWCYVQLLRAYTLRYIVRHREFIFYFFRRYKKYVFLFNNSHVEFIVPLLLSNHIDYLWMWLFFFSFVFFCVLAVYSFVKCKKSILHLLVNKLDSWFRISVLFRVAQPWFPLSILLGYQEIISITKCFRSVCTYLGHYGLLFVYMSHNVVYLF